MVDERGADTAGEKWGRIEAFWQWTGRNESGEGLLEAFLHDDPYDLLRKIYEARATGEKSKLQRNSAWRIVGPMLGFKYDPNIRDIVPDDVTDLVPDALRAWIEVTDRTIRERRAREWASYLRGESSLVPAPFTVSSLSPSPDDAPAFETDERPEPSSGHGGSPFETHPEPRSTLRKGRRRLLSFVGVGAGAGLGILLVRSFFHERTPGPSPAPTNRAPVAPKPHDSSAPAPSQTAPANVSQTPVLDVHVEAIRDHQLVPIDAEHPFQTGDGFRFKVTSMEPSYLSILAINDGKVGVRLYPRPGDADAPAEAHVMRLVPAIQDREAAFEVLSDAQSERFIVVATTRSTAPCESVKTLLDRVWKSDERPAGWDVRPVAPGPPIEEKERGSDRVVAGPCDFAVIAAAFLELPHAPSTTH